MTNRRKAYIAEFLGTAGMVGFGLLAVALFWSASSPLAALSISPGLRRLLTGFFFAGGATLIIYSPLGQLSGGHVNPSVTIGFLSLDKITLRDAAVYIIAQLAGGVAGVALLYLGLFHGLGWEDAIAVGATRPGKGYTVGVVFVAEVIITFLLMLAILLVSNRYKIARFTPAVAGLLVMTEVWLEAPISGTSLNEARSLAPAVFSGIWEHHWIYLTAPILGALFAAALYRYAPFFGSVLCSKLYHTERYECHMKNCLYRAENRRGVKHS
jgi:aquaporin Z